MIKKDTSLIGFAFVDDADCVIGVDAFFNESVYNSSTGQLIWENTEAFRVEIDIPSSITGTVYNNKKFAYYRLHGW